MNRRRFLQNSAAAASVLAAPQFIPQRAFGANERIVAGFVGLGGQGRGNLNAFLGRGVAVAGLADVDSKHLAQAMKIVEGKGHKAQGFGDYRKMLERNDIDIMVIATPDHWHALPTIHACQAGIHPQKYHEVTESCRLVYKYPDDVTMIVGQKEDDVPQGTTFIGSEGRVFVNRGKLTSDPPEILKTERKSSDVKLYDSRDHHRNFLESVASRERPICDVEIGHHSAVACHLGNIAARTKKTIVWDSAKEEIVGDSELAGMVARPYREPWKLEN
jgi:hypothetical protein